MDNRNLLPKGYRLKSSSRIYIIEKYISAGSNSIVYQAVYKDTLMPEHVHIVLIKELYPFDTQGRITRDEQMQLIVPPETARMFEYQKTSFLLGNQAHLTLSADGSERIAVNLDSFEANRTLYTVLAAKKGQVLSELLYSGKHFQTLTDTVICIKNLLDALQSFHSHNLLHLDISPENIFVPASEVDKCFSTRVLLLDFNSVYSLDMKLSSKSQYYLGKEDYMAPEVFLHREKELGYWTDLYSVSAVFYEMLTGKTLPKDRELQKEQRFVSSYAGVLLHEKESSARLVNRILAKGLQIEPKNRYQCIEEMQRDIRKLLDILNGVTRISMVQAKAGKVKKDTGKVLFRKSVRITAAVLLLSIAVFSFYMAAGLDP